MELDKVVVIKKPTQLEELLRRYATTSQVKFYLESRGDAYEFYKDAHFAYKAGLEKTLSAIPSAMRSQVVDKETLSTFQLGEKDLVVVVGDDGLVVNVAKYVGSQPIISLNPDPERFDGVLSCCNSSNFPFYLEKTLEDKVNMQALTMAEARLEDGQVMYALNDLFIGRKTHVSARYVLEYGAHYKKKERQSSDGILVCTGTGSTGWMTSVLEGAEKLVSEITSEQTLLHEVPYPRDDEKLLFAVMNPFPSKITGTNIVFGELTKKYPLTITSQMPENGVIFSDGIEEDYLEFTSGKKAIIKPADKKVYLVQNVVYGRPRQKKLF